MLAQRSSQLCLADLQSVEKAADRYAKQAKGGDKDAARKKELFDRMRKHLDEGKPVRSMGLSKEEKADAYELFLLTLKHSLALTIAMGLIALLFAYVFAAAIPAA